MNYYVYILASGRNGTLYIGVTRDLIRRVHQHREQTCAGFAGKYKVKDLVHVDVLDDPISAIAREKQLKNWHRDWKIRLIEERNPYWRDLYPELV
ncbi:GIY-YIG nuclease family protein [Herbaspirillum sp. WKF16]|jgi:putative endonuclease|uniref:GIY-YIG nuclease family protein n=1 Tax=Herbaspirillum sp. WKF16 TaxID=3028312 RepID=UPI0023A98F4B|nr:GIY-YIG nuclease family protein [Herbaspirillum sp. WKF16]WDZ96124.1 GIY-YIG nuclease family protein [Herbaspirillum sp. WKF16]